jgi:cephalosporin hydroxylase
MAFKQSLRDAARKIAPRPLLSGYHRLKIVGQARRLRALRETAHDRQAWADALWRSHFFRPLQKRTEIFRLVEILKTQRPAAVCEVGAAGGGTTFLLAAAAAPDALVITLDLAFTESRQAALKRFAHARQRLVCLKEDSHRPEAVSAVRECLAGRQLDVLYLDGDHSYEGVKADFELFTPLVRAGGLVVFHDIVPDYKTRYGIETSSYVGGVPQFWAEIKAAYGTVEEIVEDPLQDGFGIGVLHWNGVSA